MLKTKNPTTRLLLAAATCGAVLGAAHTYGQTQRARSLRYDLYMGGSQVLKAFEPVVAEAHTSVVSIRVNNRIKAFGTAVRDGGYILTKASEITPASGNDTTPQPAIECELASGTRLPATLLATDDATDLALLKIEGATETHPIRWAETATARVGQWAITASNDERPLAIGIVSVPNRPIDNKLYLGIAPKSLNDGSGIEVLYVNPAQGAHRAGMQRGDVITHINDRRVTSRDDITQSVLGLRHGDSIQVRLVRGNAIQVVSVELTANKEPDERRMQGQRSARDYGFEEVIQHDTVLSPRDCGGPLINSQGRAFGINIARAGRVASYALPVDVVLPAIDRLFESLNQPTRLNKPGSLQHDLSPRKNTPNGQPHTKPYLIQALGFAQTAYSPKSLNTPSAATATSFSMAKNQPKPYLRHAVRRRR